MLFISGMVFVKSFLREVVFFVFEYVRKYSVVVFFDVDYCLYMWELEVEIVVYYNLVVEKLDVIIGMWEEFDMMEKFLNYEELND